MCTCFYGAELYGNIKNWEWISAEGWTGAFPTDQQQMAKIYFSSFSKTLWFSVSWRFSCYLHKSTKLPRNMCDTQRAGTGL